MKAPLLIEHFAKSDKILEVGGMVPFRSAAEAGAFWQAIYERADKPRTRAISAFMAAQACFDAVDSGKLAQAEAVTLRNKGKELMTVVKTQYASEKVHLGVVARRHYD